MHISDIYIFYAELWMLQRYGSICKAYICHFGSVEYSYYRIRISTKHGELNFWDELACLSFSEVLKHETEVLVCRQISDIFRLHFFVSLFRNIKFNRMLLKFIPKVPLLTGSLSLKYWTTLRFIKVRNNNPLKYWITNSISVSIWITK